MHLAKIPQMTQKPYYIIRVKWSYLKTWLKEQEVNLNPPYQRGYVWTEDQRSKYIEYCLKGGISGRSIFLNGKDWETDGTAPLEVVDGKQRLVSICLYLNNKVKAYGCYLNETDGKLNQNTGTYIDIYIHSLKTDKEVVQWYLDLNEGGTVHTAADLAVAYYMLKYLP